MIAGKPERVHHADPISIYICSNMNNTVRMKEYRIPNLEKSCDVLELIAETPGGLPLKTISAKLNIPRTTALRITQTPLHKNHLAENDDGHFTLGPALVQVGVKALDSLDIRGYARPILRALSNDVEESSHL